MPTVQDELFGLLACPACQGSLRSVGSPTANGQPHALASSAQLGQNIQSGQNSQTSQISPIALVCDRCALEYPVEDGIAVLLQEEARPRKA